MSKERLKDIDYRKDVDTNGCIVIDKLEYEFLYEQAERAEKLQDQIDNKILPEIEKGWTENIRYKQALEQVWEMTKESIMDGRIYIVVDKALKGESE